MHQQTVLTLAVIAVILFVVLLWPLGRLPWPGLPSCFPRCRVASTKQKPRDTQRGFDEGRIGGLGGWGTALRRHR